MLSKSKGFAEIAEILIKNEANLNARDERQNTPLHLIAEISDPEKQYAIAELLINNGADVKIKNSDNKTPLDLISNERSNFMITIIILESHKNDIFSLSPITIKLKNF